MSEPTPEKPKRGNKWQLAEAIAAGAKVAPWARKNGVPRRTAYLWAKDPKVVAKVAELRRESTDQAVAILHKYAETAAATLVHLAASEASSEAVRLGAARAILAELRELGNFQELRLEIDALKARVAREEARRADRGT